MIKVFFCAKRGLLQASSETRRPEECLKEPVFSKGSWALEAPGSRPAASAAGLPHEAAPVMVSAAPVSAPVAAKLAAVAAPEAVSVPVDVAHR